MSKFKVGDRVRAKRDNGWVPAGVIGIVAENDDVPYVDWNNGRRVAVHESKMDIAFTIAPGKFYRTASDAVTGRVTKGYIGFEAVVGGRMRMFDAGGGDLHGGDNIVEEWAPKVGERVVFAADNPNGGRHYGAAGEVVEVAGVIRKDTFYGEQVGIIHPAHAWELDAPVSVLEPLPVAAPQPASLKIEAGKFYKTRDGRKVGPMGENARHNPCDKHGDGPFRTDGWNYDADGTCSNLGGDHEADLIAEWHDAPTAPVSAQVDAIAEEYGSGKREPWVDADNDNDSNTFTITFDTGNLHEELDELIAKLKKIKKLQRAVGLAA